jgi:hypothetical protein
MRARAARLPNSCCQCYQLAFDTPTYLTNSKLTPPLPLIVQSANTQASTGYPSIGQAFSGGVKPDPDSLKCNDSNNNLTDALIAADASTMQDCCMPTCAWKNNVNVATVNGYDTIYSFTADGTPVTAAK